MKLKIWYEPVKMISYITIENNRGKGYDTEGRSGEWNAKLDLLAVTLLALWVLVSIIASHQEKPSARYLCCPVALPRKSSLATPKKYGGVCQQNKENKVFKILHIMHHSHRHYLHQILQETLLEHILQADILDVVN